MDAVCKSKIRRNPWFSHVPSSPILTGLVVLAYLGKIFEMKKFENSLISGVVNIFACFRKFNSYKSCTVPSLNILSIGRGTWKCLPDKVLTTVSPMGKLHYVLPYTIRILPQFILLWIRLTHKRNVHYEISLFVGIHAELRLRNVHRLFIL